MLEQRVFVSRTLAMPADTNPRGDIFGGWIMSLMDIAAGSVAARISKGAIATRAVKDIIFDEPIFVGDEVCIYVNLLKIGNTSMTLEVEVVVHRNHQDHEIPAVKGTFVMVALDENRHPRPVKEKW